jgi:hypothetical protein
VLLQAPQVDEDDCQSDYRHSNPDELRSGKARHTRENGGQGEGASPHFAAELTFQSDEEAYSNRHAQTLEDGEKRPLFRVIHERLHLAGKQHYLQCRARGPRA